MLPMHPLVDNLIRLTLYHKHMAPPKGYKMSDENKLKRSLALKGRQRPFMIGNKYNLGKKFPISPERLAFLKARRPWNKGLGTKTTLVEQIRDCSFYTKWRIEVFTRDNFTCQLCLTRGGYLEADHIKQFALILMENKIKSLEMAEKCMELWDIENGRTLCKRCHLKTETYARNLSSLQVQAFVIS